MGEGEVAPAVEEEPVATVAEVAAGPEVIKEKKEEGEAAAPAATGAAKAAAPASIDSQVSHLHPGGSPDSGIDPQTSQGGLGRDISAGQRGERRQRAAFDGTEVEVESARTGSNSATPATKNIPTTAPMDETGVGQRPKRNDSRVRRGLQDLYSA